MRLQDALGSLSVLVCSAFVFALPAENYDTGGKQDSPAEVEVLQEKLDEMNGRLMDAESRIEQLSPVAFIQGPTLSDFVRIEEGTIEGLKGPHIIFEGANVHIHSTKGDGSTSDGGTLTGLGNLVIGYNEPVVDSMGEPLPDDMQQNHRNGSHNLIVGSQHSFTSYAGLVAGIGNTVSESNASVSGGSGNTASGSAASVSGGSGNTASGATSSVSGGWRNQAIDEFTSIGGGSNNEARGDYSSISAGQYNQTSESWASVSGGFANLARGSHASISGGNRSRPDIAQGRDERSTLSFPMKTELLVNVLRTQAPN